MSRLSFRPRPLDIHKKLPIVKSLKEFEDDDASTPTTTTRNSQIQRLVFEAENEVHQINAKKAASEIPTPQFVIVDTYERDYSRSFSQPTTYVRARGARTELSEFVEYDLDNEDEDWLQEFNNERKIITPERLENILFKLEVLDHKTRERGGIITPLGSVVPVLLQLDAAAEVLQSQDMRYAVLQSIYSYWKAKREGWQKPILRRLQPPPPVNDTNPYNVFRPREKAHRLHTRRMQRRENNVQSFEKLRQVQRNLGQAKVLLEALIKREEKKREVFECEISIQRTHMKYKNEAQLIEDGLGLGGFSSYRQASSDDDFVDSDDLENGYTYSHALAAHIPPMVDSVLATVRNVHAKREYKGRHPLQRKDPDEPIMLFAKPLDLEKLAAVGIVHPPDPPVENGGQFSGRIGRGGRIVFDRWDPLSQIPIQHREELPRKAPALPPG